MNNVKVDMNNFVSITAFLSFYHLNFQYKLFCVKNVFLVLTKKSEFVVKFKNSNVLLNSAIVGTVIGVSDVKLVI